MRIFLNYAELKIFFRKIFLKFAMSRKLQYNSQKTLHEEEYNFHLTFIHFIEMSNKCIKAIQVHHLSNVFDLQC